MLHGFNKDQDLSSHHRNRHTFGQCRKSITRFQQLQPTARRFIPAQMPGMVHLAPQPRRRIQLQDQPRHPAGSMAWMTWSGRVRTGGVGRLRPWAWAWRIGAGCGVRISPTLISSTRIIIAISCRCVNILISALFRMQNTNPPVEKHEIPEFDER